MYVQCNIGAHVVMKDVSPHTQVSQLINDLEIDQSLCYVIQNGRKIEGSCCLENGNIYHIVPRVLGGKGGFGSMLRAIGAQIEKTTSREACRDLSGRRMRDVNNEKKLKEWLAKEADREREKEERKQERLAAQLAGPKHKFDDPEYHKQRSKVQEDLDDALQKGLKRSVGKNGDSSSSSHSRPAKKVKTNSKKEWLGMDIDSDDLESNSDDEANPGSPLTDPTCQDPAVGKHPTNASEKEDENVHEPTGSNSDESGLDTPSSSLNIKTSSVEEPKSNSGDDDKPVDLDTVCSVGELKVMSLNRLKNALMCRGLKCGGTLEERAERLFSVKGLSPDEIPTALMAKSKGGGKKSKQV